jgi:hypothetical protein
MSLRIAAATAALILATSTMALAADQPVRFALNPQNGSGETGFVTMTQQGDNVVVDVTTKNAPAGLAQPIHIHAGQCEKDLNPKPAVPLTTVQNGTSTTTIKNATVSQFETGAFAINIHHSTSDVPTYYACGDIPKPFK